MEVVYLTLILSISIVSDALWLMKIISLTMVLGGTLVADLFWKENLKIEEFHRQQLEKEG